MELNLREFHRIDRNKRHKDAPCKIWPFEFAAGTPNTLFSLEVVSSNNTVYCSIKLTFIFLGILSQYIL